MFALPNSVIYAPFSCSVLWTRSGYLAKSWHSIFIGSSFPYLHSYLANTHGRAPHLLFFVKRLVMLLFMHLLACFSFLFVMRDFPLLGCSMIAGVIASGMPSACFCQSANFVVLLLVEFEIATSTQCVTSRFYV